MTYRKLLAAASAAVVITTVALGLVANVSAADKYEVIYITISPTRAEVAQQV